METAYIFPLFRLDEVRKFNFVQFCFQFLFCLYDLRNGGYADIFKCFVSTLKTIRLQAYILQNFLQTIHVLRATLNCLSLYLWNTSSFEENF